MTLYGIDVSNNNDGGRNTVDFEEVVREGIDWVMAKVTQGSDYKDADWSRTKQFCIDTSTPYIGYHYVDTSDPHGQANNWLANGGGANAMLDFENGSGDIDQYWAVVNAFRLAGITVRLSYIPHWYWQNIGSPDLSQVVGLVASNYVTGTGYASQLYPGDNSPRWFPYGGTAPIILQYSSQALVSNLAAVDANAFRGTRAQLAQLLEGTTSTGVFMALSDAEQDQLLAAVLDIQVQLRGPDLKGWAQLGQNDQGQNLTLVDAEAKIIKDEEAK